MQRRRDIDGAVRAVCDAAALRAGAAAAVLVAGFCHGPGDGEPPGLEVHVTASEGADLTVPGTGQQREAPSRFAQREYGLSLSAGEGIAFARRLPGDVDRLGDVADGEALIDRVAEHRRQRSVGRGDRGRPDAAGEDLDVQPPDMRGAKIRDDGLAEHGHHVGGHVRPVCLQGLRLQPACRVLQPPVGEVRDAGVMIQGAAGGDLLHELAQFSDALLAALRVHVPLTPSPVRGEPVVEHASPQAAAFQLVQGALPVVPSLRHRRTLTASTDRRCTHWCTHWCTHTRGALWCAVTPTTRAIRPLTRHFPLSSADSPPPRNADSSNP